MKQHQKKINGNKNNETRNVHCRNNNSRERGDFNGGRQSVWRERRGERIRVRTPQDTRDCHYTPSSSSLHVGLEAGVFMKLRPD